MQLLSCDLWLMDRGALKNLLTLASRLRTVAGNLPAPKTETELIDRVAASTAQAKRPKSIAVIPVSGALEARPTELGAFLGMSSYEVIGTVFDYFMNDSSVSGIVLDISSPGGMVYGAPELANKIYQARGTKPIIAVANPMAASGAYWLAAAADRIVATPSGDVGSVGVITEHMDLSKAYEQQGVSVSTIRSTASPFKGEFTDVSPLTEEAKQHIQSRVDAIASTFIGDLAKFRGTTTQYVAENFGKGRLVDAKSAIGAGMVDRIGTLQDITGKLASGRIRITSERARDDWNAPTIREERMGKLAAIEQAASSGATQE